MLSKMFQIPLFEKWLDIPHEKGHFFLDMNFLVDEIPNPTSSFAEKMCAFYLSNDRE